MTGRRRVLLALAACLLVALIIIIASRLHRGLEVSASAAVSVVTAEVLEAGAARPEMPPPTGSWHSITLPDNWDGRRPDYRGYVWYRFALPPSARQWQRPAVYLPAAGMNAELWLNGERVGGAGHMSMPVSRHFYTPQLIELPRSAMAGAGDGQLLVLLAGYPVIAAVWPRYGWVNMTICTTPSGCVASGPNGNAATIIVNITIAVFVLVIGWRDREHRAYVWFGAAALVWALRNLNYWVTNPRFPISLFAELCVSGAAWFTALFAIFALRLRGGQSARLPGPRWLPKTALVYAVVATLYFVSAADYGRANAGFAALAAVGVALTAWACCGWCCSPLRDRRPTWQRLPAVP